MPSSKDVAKKAGVSQATVSRVLNYPELVKEKTREKILKAIDELGYIPDANARSLVSKKTYAISLISGPLSNPFYVDTTTHIVNYATSLGYKVNVHFSTVENAKSIYELALSHKIDGLIMSCVLLNDPIVEQLQKLGLPFVSFNRRHNNVGQFVEIDNFAAGVQALQHLLDYGHKDILWIGASDIVSTFKNRFLGFKQGLKQLKKQEIKVRSINYKHLDRPDLKKLLQRLHQSGKLPTAICAATDAIAIDAMDVLVSLGLKVPQDISVIGIDNVELSQNHLIQLTTVGNKDNLCLGLMAIKKLIEMIETEPNAQDDFRITLPVSLFLRGSTQKI
ncbi:LacI family transcriptional regulator [Lonepinella koalarum]|uniref:LacI family transcriptional regulator n=1 Tax=Lonepinella koalarum TaxID=53417 RepID=A0A4R1L109_9PAST|nr:LacI family DNA-binding transcriptional regulator [Lonepinella koalarum]MDH2926761.1 transcriptional regulator [Lonepinella koalarum]TCK70580.1 LacI family transcriptional regulator [Lonepinella koalarum]TFJ90040.1 LacI family transcriptional regulator [Lonepinella koalarum]TYG33868.1 LacI family transcriptional regulator [Lonepinella koalarum]